MEADDWLWPLKASADRRRRRRLYTEAKMFSKIH